MNDVHVSAKFTLILTAVLHFNHDERCRSHCIYIYQVNMTLPFLNDIDDENQYSPLA